MTHRKQVRIYEDPNIGTVAQIEAVKLWTEIEDTCIAREPFYHAREIVLNKHLIRIRKDYGAQVAKRVEFAIMTRSPGTMDRRVMDAFEERLRIFATKKWGRLRLRDRICIKLYAQVWSLPKSHMTDPVTFI